MKTTALHCLMSAIALFASLGCDPSLEEVFADLQAAAPSYCTDYCEEKQNCSSVYRNINEDPYTSQNFGEHQEALLENELNDCILWCARKAEKSSFVRTVEGQLDDETNYTQYEYSYVHEVPGAIVAQFDECIWESGTPKCVEKVSAGNSEPYFIFLVTDVGDRDQCGAMESCLDIVKDYLTVTPEWDDTEHRCNFTNADNVPTGEYTRFTHFDTMFYN